MAWLDFSRKPAFGLDLSNLSFKMIQLKEVKGGFFVASHLQENIPPGLVVGGEIKQEAKLAAILKQALRESVKGESLTGRRVVCNLPEEKVFLRVIQLPRMKKSALAGAVYQEAEEHIPLSVSEVYLYWRLVGKSTSEKGGWDVLIAAAPRILVDSYVRFLQKSGLEAVALEPESIAVARSLAAAKRTKPVIIVDLGATGTNFTIYADGTIRFTSHIHISGQMFHECIIKALKVDKPKAVKLKVEAGLSAGKHDGKVRRALLPVVNDLAKQINDYVAFYCTHAQCEKYPKRKTDQVLLCGGDALLIGLSKELAARTKLPVGLGDPLIHISKSDPRIYSKKKRADALSRSQCLRYATAIGLALRDLDNAWN